MNIYNALGISQKSSLEKLLSRLEVMLKYHENYLKNCYKKIKEIEENKSLDINIKNIEINKLKNLIKENDKLYLEIINGLELVKQPKLKKEYDEYLKSNPNSTVNEFKNKENNFEYNPKFKIQYIKNNEKLNKIYKYKLPITLEFNANQSENYNDKIIKFFSYKTLNQQNEYSFVFADEKIIIKLMGILEYKTLLGIQDFGLYKYKIKKILLDGKMNDVDEYEVFTQINFNLMSENKEYLNYVCKVLLSDINIEIANKYNGGYVGEVVLNKNNNLSVIHQQERLCVSIENKLENMEKKIYG